MVNAVLHNLVNLAARGEVDAVDSRTTQPGQFQNRLLLSKYEIDSEALQLEREDLVSCANDRRFNLVAQRLQWWMREDEGYGEMESEVGENCYFAGEDENEDADDEEDDNKNEDENEDNNDWDLD